MNSRKHVLIIEDETDIAELLEYNLNTAGFIVTIAYDGEAGLNQAQALKVDLIVLDLMLPGIDGLAVCRRIREGSLNAKTPILMLSAKSEENDVVLGLELGADDYITKPFSPKELIARVRSIFRRLEDRQLRDQSSYSESKSLKSGPLVFDLGRHEVTLRDLILPLTLAEFKLLHALVKRPGQVQKRDNLIDELTGGDTYIIGRNVDVHIRSIRKKLGADAELIQTVRGIGYKWLD